MTYSRIVGWAVAIAAATPFLTLYAELQPYERYQPIVERQMFGQPPPGFDPTKPPSEVSAKDERAKEQELTKEQEQLKSSIHFSMINETPSGETAVGFTDNGDNKNPKHYYLKKGESRDGWTVKEADALAATMTIVKNTEQGEIEVSLSLGGNSANGGTKRAGAAPANGAGGSLGARSTLLGGGMGAGRSMGSLRERRNMRAQQKAEEAKAAAEEKKRAEEKEARLAEERAAEKEQREKEREEQRAQLLQIQEELRKAREERAKAEESGEKKGEDSNREGDGES